jgi:putative ABC transport system substrate-binding protein
VKSVPRSGDLDPALAAMTKDRVAAVIVLGNLPVPARQVAESAARYRLPSMAVLNQLAQAGALMSYGASVGDIRRRAGAYVDKILRGAKPADLPVEQPTRFELVVNQKTTRALGLTIPPSLLVRADQVID